MYEINLLKPGKISDVGRMIKDVPLPVNTIAIALAYTLLFCISAFLTTGFYLPRKSFIESRTNQEIAIKKQIDELQKDRADLQVKIKQLTDFKKEDIVWSQKLSLLSAAILPGIWLTEIRIADEDKVLAGKGNRRISQRTSKKDTYNLFGDRIQNPKKILYIVGSVINSATSSPLVKLNLFINTLMQQDFFGNEFQLLDWRLIGEQDEQQYSSIEKRKNEKIFAAKKDIIDMKQFGENIFEFELKLGIVPPVSLQTSSDDKMTMPQKFFNSIMQ